MKNERALIKYACMDKFTLMWGD